MSGAGPRATPAAPRPRLARVPPAFAGDLLRFVDEEARQCRTLPELRQFVELAAAELGFSYFALLHHSCLHDRSSRPGSGKRRIRIDNYPPEWEQELRSRLARVRDPVHAASRRCAAAFRWSAIGRCIRLDEAQRQILERSACFGLGDGFTVPINVPGEPAGSCSFAVERGRDLPARWLPLAQLVAVHSFEAARRIVALPERRAPPRLSRREVECVQLVAAGKTDWEIASILSIGVDTARQYVKSARAAYDVVSRTQLVVHAFRDGVLEYDDAIPPFG